MWEAPCWRAKPPQFAPSAGHEQRSSTGMGALSEEDLFISPMMSLVVVIVVMILMQLGSNYFNRQQQAPP